MNKKTQKSHKVINCGVSRHIGRIIMASITYNLFLYLSFLLGSPIADPVIRMFNELGNSFFILQIVDTLLASSIIYFMFIGLVHLSVKIRRKKQ